MPKFPYSKILASIVLASLLSGCGGGGARTVYNHRLTTVGQELSDLKTARDTGAITQDEYEEQREKILSGRE